MRIVLGVLAPDRGEVPWRGQRRDDELRHRLGHIARERGLYPKMRVRDQLQYLARVHGLSPAEARASADYWIGRLGVAERAGDRVEQLSLGNQQRVQLAAALVHGPELLVLDEPFSGWTRSGSTCSPKCWPSGRSRASRWSSPAVSSSWSSGSARRWRSSTAAGWSPPARWPTCAPPAATASTSFDWASGLPGTTVIGRSNGRVVLQLSDGADEQAVLDAARAAGRVTHFSAVEPSLTELFRQAVQA